MKSKCTSKRDLIKKGRLERKRKKPSTQKNFELTISKLALRHPNQCATRAAYLFQRTNLFKPGRVKEVGEVSRVVLRQEGWFEGGEVAEDDPVPAGHHQVLHLDVPVTNLRTINRSETFA